MMKYNLCSDEPIKIPGKIQYFGCILGLDEEFTVQFFSENILDFFQIPQIQLQSTLESNVELFDAIKETAVFKKLVKQDKSYTSQLSIIDVHGIPCHLSIKKNHNFYFFEFEPCTSQGNARELEYIDFDSYNSLRTEEEIWENLANDISNYTRYDRVMIYKFLEDGSGKVVAEKVADGVEGFLNLHYPADDIPQQARALYLDKKRRIFSDIDAPTYNVISLMENLDLGCVELRAMSPVHGQYLRNAGVRSSFSTSIIVDGVLWGLVTCQNIEAKHVDLKDRLRSEIYTMWAAKAYTNIRAAKLVQYSIDLDQKITHLKDNLAKNTVLTNGIIDNFSEFCRIAQADGVAMVVSGEIHTFGQTPTDHVIEKIIEHFQGKNFDDEQLYFRQSFAKKHPEIVGNDKSFAGLAIIKINREIEKYFIWFRKEFIETIQWAGNPEKHYEIIQKNGQTEMGISPRKSFQIFIEESKGKSKLWNDRDRIAIEKLITLIFEISYDHYAKIKKLNDDLVAVNEELDSFSYTISHDLGTPLTVMKLNLQMLERKLLDGNSDANAQKLENVLEQISHMEHLMRDVLSLSRAKSVDLDLNTIEMQDMIQRICNEAQIVYGNSNTTIEVGDCKDILGDHTLIYQVFLNIITNAVKYSSKVDFPIIKIDSTDTENEVIYHISDNGIGIPENERSQMFKIFKRMENAKSFYGNDVGLNIAYRIMERLGGKINFHNNGDEQGVTFVLEFKK